MLLSSPGPLDNTSLMCTEVIDIDLLEDNNCAVCGEYARDIFAYLREAEVQECITVSSSMCLGVQRCSLKDYYPI